MSWGEKVPVITHRARHAFAVWDSRLPPEFYGRERDEVKLLAIDTKSGTYSSVPFTDIPGLLRRGDLLVFNNSMLIPSSVPVFDNTTGRNGYLNFGTSWKEGMILAEPRPKSFNRLLGAAERDVTIIGPGAGMTLKGRHKAFQRFVWAGAESGEMQLSDMLLKYGAPLTYDHIPFKLPLEYYRTAFSTIPGSVEFPSAGRPFSRRVLEMLRKRGVGTAEITIHCNLSPLEPSEFDGSSSLLEERYVISHAAAEAINGAREAGGRVIAVGTSVVRALEASYDGRAVPRSAETDLFIRPGHKIKSVDGLVTGMHDPESSHVEMISSFVDDSLLQSAYSTALSLGFQWHEFGDLSLVL